MNQLLDQKSFDSAESWDQGVGTETLVAPGKSWRWISVPRPPGFGRHRLRFQVVEGGPVLVDRVEAR